MRIQFKSIHCRLTSEMRALVEDKVQTLERYAGKTASPVQAWVEVERTTQHHQRGPYYRVEIHLRVDGQALRSHSRGVRVDAAHDENGEADDHEGQQGGSATTSKFWKTPTKWRKCAIWKSR